MQMECFTVGASESTIPKLPEFYSLKSCVVSINFFLAEIMWHVITAFFPVMRSNHSATTVQQVHCMFSAMWS